MKTLFLFIIALSLSFSYDYPPHAEIASHNDALAHSLLNSSCLNSTQTNYDNPVACAEAQLITAYPSVDGRISASNPPRALWRYAYYSFMHRKTVTDENGCESSFEEVPAGTEVVANLTALFMNASYYSDNITSNPVPIPVPQSSLNLTDGSNITLILDAQFVFTFDVTEATSTQVCTPLGGCSCVSGIPRFYQKNITRTASSSLQYEVEGGSILHFLAKPVLREQWVRNSQFEDLVFSKRKFYYGQLYMDGDTFGTSRTYSFSILRDSFNAWSMSSSPASVSQNLTTSEVEMPTTPVPIEPVSENHKYIYTFDSRYYNPGEHNFTLEITDHFGNSFSENFPLWSRYLTADGAFAENGSTNISDSNYFRPSLPPSQYSFNFISVNMGIAGALIVGLILLRNVMGA